MNLPKPNCRSTDASSALREYTQGALLDCVRSGFAQCGAELQALYLFGSRARGGAGCRPGSDFDLAYFANPELSALTQFKLANDLAEALGVEHVDLVDLNSASTVLAIQVITTGDRLFTADTYAAELWETHTLAAYAQLNYERREILNEYRIKNSEAAENAEVR
ncbi:MAG: nucleotidyltransferase domain-containing protein [Opitutales bacterium]|nr:nucleotidyltransferase domain-containing protein [Opitutales bacterium]NRA27669.1 nucleotidyltransferase domain-containing protein [Opitutales bacterium]